MRDLLGCKSIVFDLDGTLYRTGEPLETQIIPAIWAVAADVLGVPVEEAAREVRRLNVEFGYCPIGFEKVHGLSAIEFIDRVYARVDRSAVHRDDELVATLSALAASRPIFILTNSARRHAREVVEKIGISESISAIFSIEDSAFNLKPDRRAFEACMAGVGMAPAEILYFDDSVRNIQAAWRLGMKTVLVSNGMAQAPLFYEMHIRIHHTAPDYVNGVAYDLNQYLGAGN